MNEKIKCPTCQSQDVVKIDIASGVSNGYSSVVNSHQYKCNMCEERFQAKGE